MANKISYVCAALERALQTLVDSGVVKDVRRGVIDPLSTPKKPVISIVCTDLGPTHGPVGERIWEAEVLLALVAAQGTGDPAEAAIDLVAAVQPVIDTLITGGAAVNGGGAVSGCRWDLWYGGESGKPLQVLGAVGSLTVTVEGPLGA